MKNIKLNAPAKINLGLNIVSKRKDGFHNLETFFYPIESLHDKITFQKAKTYSFVSNNKLLQQEKNNLITSAHNLLEKYSKKKLNVKIILDKKIPIGAGLGGGSSDAATTLVGLNKLFELNIDDDKLITFALTLGSDIPFFIKGKAAIGKSRGEVLEYSNIKINKPILIVNPGIHISTKNIFNEIIPNRSKFNYDSFLESSNIDFSLLKNNLSNDFEYFVFNKYPEIKNIKDCMYKVDALFSLMSGTGSTVYGIFNSSKDAQICFNLLPTKYFKIII